MFTEFDKETIASERTLTAGSLDLNHKESASDKLVVVAAHTKSEDELPNYEAATGGKQHRKFRFRHSCPLTAVLVTRVKMLHSNMKASKQPQVKNM